MVETYLDANANGRVDPGEAIVAAGTYDADDGICAFGFSPLVRVPAGNTVHLVIAYRMPSGVTYWSEFNFTAFRMSAAGATSGTYVPIYGLPLYSCTKTVIRTPVIVSIGEAKLLELGRTIILPRRFCPDAADVEVVDRVPAALSRALELASEEDLVLVTGSFYTIGEAG